MILNFNPSNYPLDHEWIDKNSYLYHEDYCKEIFATAYLVCCIKCGLHIKHQILNRNFWNYEEIKYHEEDEFFTYDDNLNIIYYVYDIKFNINYKEVYSCSEMLIKKLLE